MSNTTDQFARQAEDVTQDIRNMGGAVSDAAKEKLGEVREKAAESFAQAQDKIHGVACACEQYVRQEPLKAVLMAAGIGWLIGRFWKGR
jgi:ElaB/YqjD/DUF883 family membrane-anchored ribosome-binding protein